ncbi:MAG: ATP-binding protein [Oscillatoria sp. PMC 1051.18]|nr:ATP-binding protein [Oscillatoria sp. PMC 1050.18]MEC5032312.1 ATP-binding protein [Oscillatoria sp. PMC 1051.18]
MSLEPIELRLERVQQEQELILNQIDNAIALFNNQDRLILFNRKLTEIWNLPPEKLAQKPDCQEVLAAVIHQGYLSASECEKLRLAICLRDRQKVNFLLQQNNGIYLEVEITVTDRQSKLLNLRDVTNHWRSPTNVDTEIERLKFLLGLTERLQPATELREIGQFALSYLIDNMGAAFGDVKVIIGEGEERQAGILTNKISSEFIATYGEVAIKEMQDVLNKGIPYGQGLLWSVIETGKPLFVKDYQQHPQAVPSFCHPGIGQLGIFPIPGASGEIIGVLTLESRSGIGLEDAPQQDMLLAACRTLGVAIERAQDREKMRQANENLERASQLKSEFLASMSHELRTPLNSIIGFADLLQRQFGGKLTSRQINHVRAIEKSGQHLLQLINDILDLSKIEAGKTQLELESVSIQSLCNQCLRMIQPRAEKKRLTLSLEIDYRLDRAVLDLRRVSQILINLLSNAVKFTPEGGKIKLGGRLAYGTELLEEKRPDRSPVNLSTPYLCLEVVDTGIGIPKDKQHLLFQPFQQVDSSLTRRHEGTGLGLALTKRLAELHGGTVSLESQENEGSTFRVWLPMTEMRENYTLNLEPETKPSSASILAPKPQDENSKRILVVEDQPYNQALISEVLELEGYVPEIIYEGRTMMDLIHSPLVTPQVLPDLILMDIQLPDLDGFQLIHQLKNHQYWRKIPVIAVTAMAMPGDKDRCLQAGADDYISKPIDIEQLLQSIGLLLNSAEVSD